MVFFYAEWSKISTDLLDDYNIVGKTYRSDDNIVLCKMDVENYPDYAVKYDVTSYPKILVFPSEKLVMFHAFTMMGIRRKITCNI